MATLIEHAACSGDAWDMKEPVSNAVMLKYWNWLFPKLPLDEGQQWKVVSNVSIIFCCLPSADAFCQTRQKIYDWRAKFKAVAIIVVAEFFAAEPYNNHPATIEAYVKRMTAQPDYNYIYLDPDSEVRP